MFAYIKIGAFILLWENSIWKSLYIMYFATELKTNLIKVKSERISLVFLMSISLWTNFNKVSLIVFELVLFLQSKVSSHFSWYSCCFVCFQCRFVLLFLFFRKRGRLHLSALKSIGDCSFALFLCFCNSKLFNKSSAIAFAFVSAFSFFYEILQFSWTMVQFSLLQFWNIFQNFDNSTNLSLNKV